MVVEGLLKQLTLGEGRKILGEIAQLQLPDDLLVWVKEYEKVGHRDRILWQWMYKSVQIVTAPVVDQQYLERLYVLKTTVIIFVTLLDDVADNMHDASFLRELIKIPFQVNTLNRDQLSKEKLQYLSVVLNIWNYIDATLKTLPLYEQYREIFQYDFDQLLNEMNYAILVHQYPFILNTTEFWEYIPYNMQSFVSYDMDYMCATAFNTADLGCVRKVVYLLQRMAKIGNWLSTWERELQEDDITNIIFLYAVERDITDLEELKSNKDAATQKIKRGNLEKILFDEWENAYNNIDEILSLHNVVDKGIVLKGAADFLLMHLSHRNYI